LAAKGLEWESVYVNLRKLEHLEPWYVKLNPNGVVPTLDHDGKIVIESNVILEYLDDVWPDVPLRPEDPYERARMRIWMDKFEHVLHRNVNVISFIKQGRMERFKKLSEGERQKAIDRQPTEEKRFLLSRRLRDGISEEEMVFAEDRLAEVMDEVEVPLKDHPWLNGERMSLADISIAPFIERFEANRLSRLVDWNIRPATGKWWARMQASRAYQTAYAFEDPETEKS
jgi:glutathione S-transferase